MIDLLHRLASCFHRRGDSAKTEQGKNGGKREKQGMGRYRETEARQGDEVDKKAASIMQS